MNEKKKAMLNMFMFKKRKKGIMYIKDTDRKVFFMLHQV